MDQALPDSTYLSPLEWLMPRTYMRQLLCFPSTNPRVWDVLRLGLAGVITDVPYLLSGVDEANSPKGAVRLTNPYQTLDDLFSYEDLSQSLNYTALRSAHFPPSAFSKPGISPSETQPPFPDPAPVFRARLSIIKGGCILCVAVHHCTTDITGCGALLKIWAARCRTGSSDGIGFDPTWLDRNALFHPSIETPSSVPPLLHIRDPTTVTIRGGAELKSELETRIFFFSHDALHSLKSVVNAHLALLETGVEWVSTGDILTAVLWSAVISAEYEPSSLEDTKWTSTIGLPVSFRSRYHPPLPRDYLGVAFGMTTATALKADLLNLSRKRLCSVVDPVLGSDTISALARIAAAVRASIGRADETSIQQILAYTACQQDMTSIKLGPPHDGISIVSWADQEIYELDWGDVMRRCEAVRLPKLTGRRYPIILPRVPATRNRAGGLEVIVSLEKKVMSRFSETIFLGKFAQVICAE